MSDFGNINITGLGFITVMIISMFLLPRRLAVIPLILSLCFITLGQRIEFGGMNFTVMRIIILSGWVRVLIYKETSEIKLNIIDKNLICWAIISVITYNLLIQSWDEVFRSFGHAYNAIGSYFLFRFMIRDFEDMERMIKILAFIMVPLAIFMLMEKLTGRNMFSMFGGVPEITIEREGRLRAQGPFAHPILAGSFAATSIILFLGLCFEKAPKRLAATGLLSAGFMMIASASSGPIMAFAAGMLGLIMWPFRRQTRAIFWLCLMAIISMHLLMKAPIWFLIGRLSHIIGGTGWHRAVLIDEAIKHFNEWWVIGTLYTANWAIGNELILLPDNRNMVDITNQYIFIGVNGGIFPVIIFLALIIFCFKEIGRSIRLIDDKNNNRKIIIWAMGATLFAHSMSFTSVVYFDQTIIFFYLLLSMIASLGQMSKEILEKGG